MVDDRTAQERQRAYDLGVEAAELKAALKDHTRRLDAINGSIDRTATEMAKVRETLGVLCDDLRTRGAVEKALKVTVDKAAEEQVTSRQFGIGIGMMLIALVSLYLGAR